jgi:hypothetical protein
MLSENTGAEVQVQTVQTTPKEGWGSLVFNQTLQNCSTALNIPEEYNAMLTPLVARTKYKLL